MNLFTQVFEVWFEPEYGEPYIIGRHKTIEGAFKKVGVKRTQLMNEEGLECSIVTKVKSTIESYRWTGDVNIWIERHNLED